MLLATNLLSRGKFAQTPGEMPDEQRRKKYSYNPINANISPRLREFLDGFIAANDRKSAVAVIEEALREYFQKRGLKVDADPEEVLREILEKRGKK